MEETSAYTATLESGNVLVVEYRATVGEVITGGIMLALIAVLMIDFTFRLVYRR